MEDIESEAKELIKSGNVLNYGLNLIERFHAGDKHIGKIAILTCIQHGVKNIETGLYLNLVGGYGQGKSHILKKLGKILMSNWVYETSLSGKVLFYMNPEDDIYNTKIIYSDDIEWDPLLIALLKRVLSDYTDETTHTTLVNQKLEAKTIRSKFGFWITTVDSIPDSQLADRFININVDESKIHNNNVSMAIQNNEKGIKLNISDIRDVKIFRTAINLLCSKPYNITWNFDVKFKDVNNRMQGIFYSILKCITLLNQYNRVIKDDVIYATEEDFNITLDILNPIFSGNIMKLSKSEYDILKIIGNSHKDIKTIDIVKGSKLSHSTVIRRLNTLLEKVPSLSCEKLGQTYYYNINSNYIVYCNIYNNITITTNSDSNIIVDDNDDEYSWEMIPQAFEQPIPDEYM